MPERLGDQTYPNSDTRTFENTSGSAVEAGEFVVVGGEEILGLADVDGVGGKLVGVVEDGIDAGEYGTVHLRGAVPARVTDAVAAGNELGAPDSSGTGTPGEAVAGGASGVIALEDAYAVDGVDRAEVLLR